jgi:hypothetical protein
LASVRRENRLAEATGKGCAMHVVIRSYSGQGASELVDLLGQREEDVRSVMSGVPGFVSYAAFRTGAGGTTVTVCQGKAGTDESSRRAAEWVKENVSTTVDPPTTTEGSTFLRFRIALVKTPGAALRGVRLARLSAQLRRTNSPAQTQRSGELR